MPTRQECFDLIKRYASPFGVVKQVETVNKIAMYLAEKLDGKGQRLNLDLVEAASLLYAVGAPYHQEKNPTKESYKLLIEEGYLDVAKIVLKHDIFAPLEPARRPETWEEKIVFYAEKRVKDCQIVSLEEKLKGLKQKHLALTKKIERAEKYCYSLEKEIEQKIGSLKNLDI